MKETGMELYVRKIRHELIEHLNKKWIVEVDSFDEMFYRIKLLKKK